MTVCETGVFENNISQCPTVEVNGETICKVSSPSPSWDEAQANANIMSAGPDMYEALKGTLSDLVNLLETTSVKLGQPTLLNIEKAKQALAKAEGK